MKKRMMSIVLVICMVLLYVPTTAFATGPVTGSTSSVSAYATKAQLMTAFTPDSNGNATNIGKLVFGKKSDGTTAQEWYILGKDDGVSGDNTIIFAASPIANISAFEDNYAENKTFESSFGVYASNPSEVYPNHYGASDLREELKNMAGNATYFTNAEQEMMNVTTVTTEDKKNSTTYTTSDKLYALAADGSGASYTTIKAGNENQTVLSMNHYWSSGNRFWLRSPYDSDGGKNAMFADPTGPYVNSGLVNNEHTSYTVQPASNLNLSSVLFASAATAAVSDTAESGIITDGTAMTLRLDGSSKNIGAALYSTITDDIKVTKGSTTGNVALVVQGNDGTNDWYYSKLITGTAVVNATAIETETNTPSSIDLSACKIWLEITDTDGLIYAVGADYSGSCGTNLTWSLDDKGTLTISGTGIMEDWSSNTNVPWYNYCSSIKTIVIKDDDTSDVRTIGDRAFINCTSLTSITIPDGVTSIGDAAFMRCTNLTSITICDGVESIGNSAFWECTNLTSITIPDSVTSIGDAAFKGCTNLTSITICDGVESIGSSAFRECTNLTSITIPDSVTSIRADAFYSCTNLGCIFLPDKDSLSIGVTAIPDTTSQVKYSVTNKEVTITEIVLKNGMTTVDIPATICGDPVVAVATEYQGKVGAHTHDLSNIPAKAATVTETGNKEYWHCEICGKNFSDENGGNEIADLEAWKTGDGKLDKLPLEITVGAGQSVTAGKKKDLTFRSNAAFSDFVRVELDGVAVNSENYSVTEGSTIVTLKADYVASLSAGQHTIGIVSTSGTATAQFTVSTASTGGSYAHIHKLTQVEEKPATCTASGNKAYYVCSGCGYWYEDASGRVRIADHNSVVIPQIASVKLSVSSYTYNGKTASPTVIVEDSAGNRLVENTDYTVTVPTGRKNAGTYSYVVDFKGNYEGSQELTLTIQKASYTPTAKSYTGTYNGKKHSITLTSVKSGSTILYRTSSSKSWTTTKPSRTSVGKTTVYYKITNKNYQTITGYKTIVIKPKKTQVTGLNRGEKSFEVIWAKKTTQTTGYQIQYSTSSTFKSGNKTVTVASSTTTRKTIKNLQAKKRYYVRVRTYKTVNGVKYYSEWSAKKTVTTR